MECVINSNELTFTNQILLYCNKRKALQRQSTGHRNRNYFEFIDYVNNKYDQYIDLVDNYIGRTALLQFKTKF